MGFTYQMLQFQEERLFGAASGIDGLFNVIDETIAYTGQRQAFSQSILDNQYVHFRLAELRTEVEALQALVYQTTEAYLSGKHAPEHIAMLQRSEERRVGKECVSTSSYRSATNT